MKTVAQWAEQLPELIRIELISEAKKQRKLYRKEVGLDWALDRIVWGDTSMGGEFFELIYNTSIYDLTSADYIDETIPYTKEEVEAMILEYADPNDEVCKVMLANINTYIGLRNKHIKHSPKAMDFSEANGVELKSTHSFIVAPSANAKPIVLDELGKIKFIETKEFDGKDAKVFVLDEEGQAPTPPIDHAMKWGVNNQIEAPKGVKIMDVHQNLEDNFKPLHDNQTTVDYDFARKGANPTLKALEQTGFLLDEPQASSVNDYILAKENEALKREVEFLKEKIKKLQEEQFEEYTKHRGVVFRMNDEIMARNETIKIQKETIATLTQMAVPTPKKEQSIFFDLLKHLNIIKK